MIGASYSTSTTVVFAKFIEILIVEKISQSTFYRIFFLEVAKWVKMGLNIAVRQVC